MQGNSAAYDLYYFLTDYLNSTTKTVKQDGTVAEQRYTAWGETRHTDGDIPTNRLYTGQRQDEAGPYFYNVRWYDGQLVSPDGGYLAVVEPGYQSLVRIDLIDRTPTYILQSECPISWTGWVPEE